MSPQEQSASGASIVGDHNPSILAQVDTLYNDCSVSLLCQVFGWWRVLNRINAILIFQIVSHKSKSDLLKIIKQCDRLRKRAKVAAIANNSWLTIWQQQVRDTGR
jgi:hypothetical protein